MENTCQGWYLVYCVAILSQTLCFTGLVVGRSCLTTYRNNGSVRIRIRVRVRVRDTIQIIGYVVG